MGTENWDDRLAMERGMATDEAARQEQAAVDYQRRVREAREQAAGMAEFGRWFADQAEAASIPGETEVHKDTTRRWGKTTRLTGWWVNVDMDDGTMDRPFHKRVFMTDLGMLYDREHDSNMLIGPATGPVRLVSDLGEPGGQHPNLRAPAIQQAFIQRLARGK